MSLITKIILDTTEYNRLLSIEKAYNELKKKGLERNQGGSGTTKQCACGDKTECTCVEPTSTSSLSQIIQTNEQASAVDVPPRGVLPSITDPNEKQLGTGSKQNHIVKDENREKEKETFDPTNFRSLANATDNWYFLGHFEEK